MDSYSSKSGKKFPPAPSTAFSMSNPSFPGRTKKGGRRKLSYGGRREKKGRGEERTEKELSPLFLP